MVTPVHSCHTLRPADSQSFFSEALKKSRRSTALSCLTMVKRKSGAIKVTCSAKKSAKASSCSISANKLNKQLMLVSVNYIAEQIVMEKKKNEGRVPWGFASKLLKEGQQMFPKISM